MNNGIQTNKSEYHKETLAAEIKKSCLAKVIMLVAVMLLLMLSAKLTIPSDEQMMYGTLDGVCQCIQDSHGVPGDKSDDIVRNGIATVSHETDSAKKDTILADFKKFNRVEIYHQQLQLAWRTCRRRYLRIGDSYGQLQRLRAPQWSYSQGIQPANHQADHHIGHLYGRQS